MEPEMIRELAKKGAKVEYGMLQERMNYLRAEFPDLDTDDTLRLDPDPEPKRMAGPKKFIWTPEKRAEAAARMSARMKAYWAKRKRAKKAA